MKWRLRSCRCESGHGCASSLKYFKYFPMKCMHMYEEMVGVGIKQLPTIC